MRVYVIDIEMVRDRPVLLGMTLEGERVCARVIDFRWPVYIEPRMYTFSGERSRPDAVLEWAHKTVIPRLQAGTPTRVESRRTMYGASVSRLMFRVDCRTPREMHTLARDLEDTCIVHHAKTLDPMLAFMHMTGVRCFACVTLTACVPVTTRWSTCTHEVTVRWGGIRGESSTDCPPLTVATFDLETSGLHPEAGDEIYMASVVIDDIHKTAPARRVLLTRVPVGIFDPACEVVMCGDERTLIVDLVRVIRDSGAVFVTGWNILGFDVPFLMARCRHLDRQSIRMMQSLSWLMATEAAVSSRKVCLRSTAIGHNEMEVPSTPGIVWLDGLILARKSTLRLQNFKLKTWATWAGIEKLDVDIGRVDFTTIGHDEATRVGEYCDRDSVATRRVLERMSQPREFMALTMRSGVPPRYTMTRGQQILVFSLLAEEAVMRHGMVVNTPPASMSRLSDSYQGATVITPTCGLFSDPVTILDFSSLYPSLMISHNICTSRFVGTCPEVEAAERYTDGHTLINLGDGVSVVYSPGDTPGVLPAVLTRLLDERASIKKKLRDHGVNSIAYESLNCMQEAAKKLNNSCYGCFGAKQSLMSAMVVAASVTAAGRQALELTRRTITEMRDSGHLPDGTRVIYGDSVAGDSPIMVLDPRDQSVRAMPIASAVGHTIWEPGFHGQEYAPGCGLLVWDGWGLSRVKTVFRRRLAPHKAMYRVTTPLGTVDCTDDHSLFRKDWSVVSPKVLVSGEELLHGSDHLLLAVAAGGGTPPTRQDLLDMLGRPLSPCEVAQACLVARRLGIHAVISRDRRLVLQVGVPPPTRLPIVTHVVLLRSLWSASGAGRPAAESSSRRSRHYHCDPAARAGALSL
jgi:DNA polymerase elongation subunit (family B)